MFNEQHKKEMPLIGMLGMGGGIARARSGGIDASGGTKTTSGSDTIHTFLRSSGATQSFVINSGDFNIQLLMVAGGGGGGSGRGAGGGGAGAAPTSTAVGTATHVLTSNGSGVAPTFQVLPASGITAGKSIVFAMLFGF